MTREIKIKMLNGHIPKPYFSPKEKLMNFLLSSDKPNNRFTENNNVRRKNNVKDVGIISST